MNFNKVVLLGRLVRNPELNKSPIGTSFCKARMATNRYYIRNGKSVRETSFHVIVFWGKLAELVCKYATKGYLLLVEGHLTSQAWKDVGGVNHSSVEIVVESFQLPEKSKTNLQEYATDEDGDEGSRCEKTCGCRGRACDCGGCIDDGNGGNACSNCES